MQCFSLQPQSQPSYLGFAALMFANFFGIRQVRFPAQAIGILILLALLIAAITSVRRLSIRPTPAFAQEDRNRALIVIGLIVFSLLFCANTAYGRACGGAGVALQSRYSIYLEPAVLGFYFFLLSLRRESRRSMLSVFLIVVIAGSLYLDRGGMGFSRDVKRRWKACYLRTENVPECDQSVGFPIYPDSPEPARLKALQEKLTYLKTTHQNLYLDQKAP